jgi:hypothetical protein
MRMRVLGMCVALVCPFLVCSETGPALAGYFHSGNQLYDLCNSDEGSPQVGHYFRKSKIDWSISTYR